MRQVKNLSRDAMVRLGAKEAGDDMCHTYTHP
jgi:hypothetical protein